MYRDNYKCIGNPERNKIAIIVSSVFYSLFFSIHSLPKRVALQGTHDMRAVSRNFFRCRQDRYRNDQRSLALPRAEFERQEITAKTIESVRFLQFARESEKKKPASMPFLSSSYCRANFSLQSLLVYYDPRSIQFLARSQFSMYQSTVSLIACSKGVN